MLRQAVKNRRFMNETYIKVNCLLTYLILLCKRIVFGQYNVNDILRFFRYFLKVTVFMTSLLRKIPKSVMKKFYHTEKERNRINQ